MFLFLEILNSFLMNFNSKLMVGTAYGCMSVFDVSKFHLITFMAP